MYPADDPIASIQRMHVRQKIAALVLGLQMHSLALVRPHFAQRLQVGKLRLYARDEKSQIASHRSKQEDHALLVGGRKAERPQHGPAIDGAGVNSAAGIPADNRTAAVTAFAKGPAGGAIFEVVADDVQHVLPVLFELLANGKLAEAAGHVAPGAVSAEEGTDAVRAIGSVVSLGGNFAELAGDAGPIEKELFEANRNTRPATFDAACLQQAREGPKVSLHFPRAEAGVAVKLGGARRAAELVGVFAESGDDLFFGHGGSLVVGTSS